ncbi:hypothetical protein B0H12DRAFT_1133621 [Mycena haematopus]|nr:hypothetical protein B0H12DRAFT_1133621 [Mycena haematopus]
MDGWKALVLLSRRCRCPARPALVSPSPCNPPPRCPPPSSIRRATHIPFPPHERMLARRARTLEPSISQINDPGTEPNIVIFSIAAYSRPAIILSLSLSHLDSSFHHHHSSAHHLSDPFNLVSLSINHSKPKKQHSHDYRLPFFRRFCFSSLSLSPFLRSILATLSAQSTHSLSILFCQLSSTNQPPLYYPSPFLPATSRVYVSPDDDIPLVFVHS